MTGLISELDMLSGACTVSLVNDPETSDPASRVTARIVDPSVHLPNNPYAQALSEVSSITFTAKAEINADGNVITLCVSDCQGQASTGDTDHAT